MIPRGTSVRLIRDVVPPHAIKGHSGVYEGMMADRHLIDLGHVRILVARENFKVLT